MLTRRDALRLGALSAAGVGLGLGAATTRTAVAAEHLGRLHGGTYFCQQDYSQNYTTQFANCLNIPGTAGISWRPRMDTVCNSAGNVITTSSGRLGHALGAVRAWNTAHPTVAPKKLVVRPISGQYTPQAWLNALPSTLKFTSGGKTGVHPCYRTTGAPNTIYEGRYRTFWQQLVAWQQANADVVVGLYPPWYGFNYAEVYYGTPVQFGASGYTATQWRAGCKRLMGIIHAETPASVFIAWGMSGHGPIVGSFNPAIEDFTDELVRLYGSMSDRAYGGAHGWWEGQIFGGQTAQDEANKQAAMLSRPANVLVQHIINGAHPSSNWTVAYDYALQVASGKVWLAEPYVSQAQPGQPNLTSLRSAVLDFAATVAAQ